MRTLLLGLLLSSLVSCHDGLGELPPRGGIKTLYRHDPLAATMSFRSGADGHVVQDHEAKNRQSDIDFGRYGHGSDQFTVGIEGFRKGAIVDLGSTAEMRDRFGSEETVGLVQGFTSIRRRGAELVIRKGADDVQPIPDATALAASQSCASALVRVGHVYLVRVHGGDKEERIVKLLVLAHRPGESVTFRWERLDGGG